MRMRFMLGCSLVVAACACAAETKMPSLSGMPERHVTIARAEGDYISFPDVCVTESGRLICVYRVADKHVAKRSRTEIKTSDDDGKTWSAPTDLGSPGHCPRLAVMEDGEVLLITDSSPVGGAVYRSSDEGRTWSEPTQTGLRHGIPDRPLRIGETSLLTTGHRHVGRAKSPLLGQAPSAQIMYRSDDMGATWFEWAPLAFDPRLVLCEASMFTMPDGSLRAYLRENSGVQEPTYVTASFDEGASWTPPEDSPTIGHRPCAGLLRSGRVLVTYRHVGPNGGNRAWLGDVDGDRHFAPSGFDVGSGVALVEGALRTENGNGDEDAVLYSLRPITDPRVASASLEVELAVERNAGRHCGVHLGCQWHIFPDRIVADVAGVEPVAIDATVPRTCRFTYERGVVGLAIDGEARLTIDLAERGLPIDRSRRVVCIGNVPTALPTLGPFRFAENAGKSTFRSIELRIDEPRNRDYEWAWKPADGLPNQYEVDHVLELQNDRHSPPGDFGYSGWVQLADGRVFCVAHYRGDAELSYVAGTWIEETDFGTVAR